jgi:hypothetical protein
LEPMKCLVVLLLYLLVCYTVHCCLFLFWPYLIYLQTFLKQYVVKGVFFVVRVTLVPVSYLRIIHSIKEVSGSCVLDKGSSHLALRTGRKWVFMRVTGPVYVNE